MVWRTRAASPRGPLWLPTLLLLGACVTPLVAQTKTDDDPFTTPSSKEAAPRVDLDSILATKISYEGGQTVEVLFHYLREMVSHVNFVVAPEAARTRLPNLQFENLSLATVFELLPQVTQGRIRVATDMIQQHSPDEDLVILVTFVETSDPPETRVISVKRLLGNMDKATLLEAFDDGLGFLGAENKPEIAFHEKTGLLFVRGTPHQTHFLLEMVHAMEGIHYPGMGSMPGMANRGAPGLGGMGGMPGGASHMGEGDAGGFGGPPPSYGGTGFPGGGFGGPPPGYGGTGFPGGFGSPGAGGYPGGAAPGGAAPFGGAAGGFAPPGAAPAGAPLGVGAGGAPAASEGGEETGKPAGNSGSTGGGGIGAGGRGVGIPGGGGASSGGGSF